jgi:hypothetical protein
VTTLTIFEKQACFKKQGNSICLWITDEQNPFVQKKMVLVQERSGVILNDSALYNF